MNLTRITATVFVLGTLAWGTSSTYAQTPLVGEIKMVGFNFAPVGYAMCEGQLLSISQNTALFSLLGTQFGGDGIHTFALPDMRSRVPMGQGTGIGLSPRVIGEVGGQENYTLTISQLPAHSHPLQASIVEATVVSPDGASLAAKARVPLYTSGSPTVMMNAASVGSTGGNQPYPVLPPYLVVTFIIATEGIYPSRG
jgi:microcystin-dependent protein